MNNFKIGDFIRCVNDEGTELHAHETTYYTISSISNDGEHVNVSSYDEKFYFYKRFELVKSVDQTDKMLFQSLVA